MKHLAPIVLFVFNRERHTEQTLNALMENSLADESILYIYSDGFKDNSLPEEVICINKVRRIIRAKQWCKEVHIIESKDNKGLANSIVEGVSEIVNQYGKVIVLEDDIVTSKGFLTYMNNALSFYENEEKVMHISGFMYPHDELLQQTLFYNVPLCWGWGTWQRAWKFFEPETKQLVNYFDASNSWDNMNKFGGNVLEKQLRDNLSGKLKTWFIKWHSSILMQKGFCLFPGKSMVNNIGFDGTGIHNVSTENYSHYQLAESISVRKILLKESVLAEKVIKMFYLRLPHGNVKLTYEQKVKINLLKIIPFKSNLKRVINKVVRWSFPELQIFKSNYYNYTLLKSIESDVILGRECKLYKPFQFYNVQIGKYSYVARNSFISETIIGKFCSIGPNFMCGRGLHPVNGISTSPMFYSTVKQNGITLSSTDKIVERKTIVIGNDVFIGANVTVLDGVIIGDGAVIGAGAVVSKDIPAYAIAVGCPIQIIKYRFNDEQIEKLLKLNWWDFAEQDLADVEKYFFDIDEFIKKYSNA